MTEFKPGAKVSFPVIVKGTVTNKTAVDGRLEVRVDRIDTGPSDDQYVIFHVPEDEDRLYMSARSAGMKLADPFCWPPQKGDIWEAEGGEWFARVSLNEGVYLVPATTGQLDTYYSRSLPGRTHDFEAFKALSPVLARRRGQDAGNRQIPKNF